MTEHYRRYNWKRIIREYPAVTDRRAGVVLIYNGAVLIVTHRARGNSRANRGVPKGGAAPADKSALDTALRELEEETGINVKLPCFSARISGGAVVVEGPNRPDELHIYFIIEIAAEPVVRLCYKELIAHEWVAVDDLLRLDPISIASSLLFTALLRVDMNTKCVCAVVPALELEGV